VVRGAVGAVVGGAALGVANKLMSRAKAPKVLGIRVPDELNPSRLDPSKLTRHVDVKRMTKNVDVKKLAKNVDLKDVVRHIGDFAEQVESRSEDLHMLSGQAKRLSRKIG